MGAAEQQATPASVPGTATATATATGAGLSRWRVAMRLLWRDWRGGELTLLLAALVLAVATVTAISLFVDRLRGALVAESATFLAADRVISASRPVPDAWLTQAAAAGLQTARTLTFTSMAFHGQRNLLVSVKAVTPGYPLRGRLETGAVPFAPGQVDQGVPPVGDVWLESRAFAALGLVPGDRVELGRTSLVARKVLVNEPDRGGGFFGLGPRLLMNWEDVAATDLVQPGSRLSYRLLLAGDANALEDLRGQLGDVLAPHFRWIDVRAGSPSVAAAIERAESFLLLGGLLAVVLAGVAVALAAHRYARRHQDPVAVLKTMGLTPARVAQLYGAMLVLLGGVATALGAALGVLAHFGIVAALGQLVPVALPAPGLEPFLVGAVTGFVCLLAFAVPPLLRLRGVSPMRVIRRDYGDTRASTTLAYVCGGAGVVVLLFWYSGSLMLTGVVLGGGVLVSLVLSLLAFGLLRSGRVLGMQAGSAWRLALAGMQRRGGENVAQILIFSLALMLLLTLVVVRTDLLDDWQAQLPENAPNHFILNVTPDEVVPVRDMLAKAGVSSGGQFPMMRGRMLAVNGTTVDTWVETRGAAVESAPPPSSERNITWSNSLPSGNTLVAGDWWSEADGNSKALLSLEQDYAETAGIGVGDRLLFGVADRQVEVLVTNIRTVDWDSMQPNFYTVFSPAALADLPATYLSSFHLPAANKRFLNTFLNRFPTVTVIEIDAVLVRIREIIARVTAAVELVLGLVLISGALVLLAGIQASRDTRMQEQALVRTLGATRRLVLGALTIEFCALGLFAGVLAALGTEATVWGLQDQVFGLAWSPHPWIWLLGPVLGASLIGALGLLATRKIVATPPVVVLRDVAN